MKKPLLTIILILLVPTKIYEYKPWSEMVQRIMTAPIWDLDDCEIALDCE